MVPARFLIVAVAFASPGLAAEFRIATGGKADVVILAPGDNEPAGKRLADRVVKLTSTRVDVTGQVPAAPAAIVAIGTPETNPVVKAVLAGDRRVADLGDEGYVLKVARWQDRPVLIAAGKTLAGAQHAVSELVSWKLKLESRGASVAADLDAADRPALKYRIVWTWDGPCNWANSVPETMALYVNGDPAVGTMAVPYTADGFRTHMTRAIDYLSDHKLNGLIVWGFLRDEHGGVEMGREISRYGKRNNVRLLPGVCSQGGYGGFIFSRTNKFNLDVWCQQHPELRAKNEKGEYVAGMIDPSKAENQKWLREGAEWLFQNVPDIGGINLENGDFFTCHCDDCRKARARPENDPNCLWDMTVSQKPILEVARRAKPDGWMTFATYVGFTEATAKNAGKKAVFPPKFLKQVPDNGVCQWTVTGMASPKGWPEGTRLPEAAFKDHIGLLHHGSLWGSPVDPGRWWSLPGAWNDEYSTVLPFVCGRAAKAGLAGLVITAQNGNQCPAHELNYVAFEYFSWHPERTYEQFQKDRLDPCYGGPKRAELYLKLLRDTTKTASDIDGARKLALETSKADDLDVRQRGRWVNLAGELDRRLKALKEPKK